MQRNKGFKIAMSGVLSLALFVSIGPLTFAKPSAEPADTVPEKTYETYYTDSYDFTDKVSKEALLTEASEFPENYDLRDKGLVTSVKLQNPFGSCWAFAAVTAAETSLINSGLADLDTVDLSERHLSVFTFTPIKDERSSQYGEGFRDENMSTAQKLDFGGNATIASSVFASGVGPVLEKDDPDLIYKGKNGNIDQRTDKDGNLFDFSYSKYDDWSVPYERRNEADFSLKESYLLPIPAVVENNQYSYNEAATAAIKKQLLEGHAVQIGFLADQASPGDEDKEPVVLSEDWAQYGSYINIANHAVTIVGWDDTIGSEESDVKFRPTSDPIKDGFGPGAWLVKNSWGSGEQEFPNRGTGTWGIPNGSGEGTGYFWLSYYDHSISLAEAVEFEENKHYTMEAYDYMPAYEMHATDFEDEVKMANLFDAKENEVLRQISFYTTHPNTTVNYEVYLLPQDSAQASSGLLAAQGTKAFEFGGFHKVDLDTPVTLMAGQTFSIVITETVEDAATSKKTYYATVPVASAEQFNGVVNGGESELFREGTWLDLSSEDTAEMLTKMEDAEQEVTYDNFPIKGYAEPIEDLAFTMDLKGSKELFFTPERRKSTLKLGATMLYGKKLPAGWKAKWVLDDTIYSVTGEPVGKGPLVNINGLDAENCGNKATISVRKDGDTYIEGTSNLYIYLTAGDRLLGTIVNSISSNKVGLDGITFVDPDAEYIYNGSAFEPAFHVIDFAGGTLMPEEYTAVYKNNIKCGVATIEVTPCEDYVQFDEPTKTYFAIRPAGAVLNSVTAGACSLTLQLKDQSASGITGYKVQYRPKGTTKWATKVLPASKSTLLLSGLKSGTAYEVRVCGHVDIPNADQYYDQVEDSYDGEFSKVLTSGITKPAKAVIKKLAVGKNKLGIKVLNQKSTGINGYLIEYRVKGTSKWKHKALKATTNKVILTKMKKGYRYQVRVRGYQKVNGKYIFGAYSKVKTSKKVK